MHNTSVLSKLQKSYNLSFCAQKAYTRTFSKINIVQGNLPSFLRFPFTPNLDMSMSRPDPFHSRLTERLNSRPKNLERSEFYNLKEDGPLSSEIIDSCMKNLKTKNREITKENECSDRVFIATAAFTADIFNKKPIVSKVNLTKYDYVLLPLNIGHWTLMVMNFREKKVYYYDPCIGQSELCSKLAALFAFLKREVAHHEHKDVEHTPWRDFVYEKTAQETLDPADSGVFIVKQAESFCIGSNMHFSPRRVLDYRSEILQGLLPKK